MGEFGPDSDGAERSLDRRADAADRARESDGPIDVQHGREGDQQWYDAVEDGRSVSTVEGSQHEGGWFEMTRATAVHGEAGDRGVDSLRREFDGAGIEVRASPDLRTVDGSGSRRDVSDRFGTPDRLGPVATEGAEVVVEPVDVGGADVVPERPDIPSQYPADYVPSDEADDRRLVELREADASPRAWIKEINPGYEADAQRRAEQLPLSRLNRVQNCADCARSVQDTLDGRAHTAAAGTKETGARITEWAGHPPEATDYDAVAERLARPGDSAVLAATGPDRFGHAFNAVNIDGTVCYVDGQIGRVAEWPPPFVEDTSSLNAWYFTR